jgi:hypothetical protein
MFRRLLEWWRKPAKHSYGVYARGRRIATAVTAEDADQYIKETFNEIMSQEQRSRKGFGGTRTTRHDANSGRRIATNSRSRGYPMNEYDVRGALVVYRRARYRRHRSSHDSNTMECSISWASPKASDREADEQAHRRMGCPGQLSRGRTFPDRVLNTPNNTEDIGHVHKRISF